MDRGDVEALLDAAFGADRHGRTAYRLRDGLRPIAALSLAALEGDLLVGSIQCWPIELAADRGATVPLTLVGPVAVHPERQGIGIGRALMHRVIDLAPTLGGEALLLIGDPDYYDTLFGFSANATGGWRVPGPVERYRLLARIGPAVALPAEGMLRPSTAALDRVG